MSSWFIHRKKEIICAFLIFFCSAGVRFFHFGFPSEVVFDETYYGRFAAGYLTNGNTFSGHPPLGALIITFGGWLGGLDNPDLFSTIGNPLEFESFIYMRLLVTLAGMLIPVIAFLLARKIGLSLMYACALGVALSFENSLVVASRFIMADSFLLLFGFGSLLVYAHAWSRKSVLLKIIAGFLAGAALSVKWTGLSFAGVIVVCELVSVLAEKHKSLTREAGQIFMRIVIFCLVPVIIIYTASFALHFIVLDEFQFKSFPEKIHRAHKDLIYSNTHVSGHPAQSTWRTWPLMSKPISYWVGKGRPSGMYERIFFTGNLILYVLSAAAILASLVLLIRAFSLLVIRKKILSPGALTLSLIILGFLANYLPFILITRPMFLYHYMPALICGTAGLFYLMQIVGSKKKTLPVITLICILTCVVANFILTSSFTYGYVVSDKTLHLKLWDPKFESLKFW